MSCSDTKSPGVVYSDSDIGNMPFYSLGGQLSGVMMAVDDADIPASMKKAPLVNFQLTDRGQARNIWALVAFFRDPAVVCTDTKQVEDLGDRIILMDGASGNFVTPPMKLDDDALSSEGWVKGKCFPTMGLHYWRNITPDTARDDFYPVFLLYNGKKLNGFGLVLTRHTNPLTSKRFEHPGTNVLSLFFEPATQPDFTKVAGLELDTEHIYMSNPLFDFC